MKTIKFIFKYGILVILGGLIYISISGDTFDLKTDKVGADKLLTKTGYSDIEWLPYTPFYCLKGDWYSTHFIAKKNDNMIEGVVCKTVFGSSHIRFIEERK